MLGIASQLLDRRIIQSILILCPILCPCILVAQPTISKEKSISKSISTQPLKEIQPKLIEQGSISRQELAPYLSQGPQPIMASVRVLPVRAQGRFKGFQLVMIATGSPAERAGLQNGDIIFKMNDSSIEQPQQVMDLWAKLSKREAITLSFYRKGELFTYRWLLTP